MASKTMNMTEGSLGKSILLFSLPLMLSNLLQILFTMSDVAVVGRFAGSLALGAVGSTTTLVMLFTGVLDVPLSLMRGAIVNLFDFVIGLVPFL